MAPGHEINHVAHVETQKCIHVVSDVILLLFIHRDARVVKDMATGKSKGYGFVSFFNKWVSTQETRRAKSLFSVRHHIKKNTVNVELSFS